MKAMHSLMKLPPFFYNEALEMRKLDLYPTEHDRDYCIQACNFSNEAACVSERIYLEWTVEVVHTTTKLKCVFTVVKKSSKTI